MLRRLLLVCALSGGGIGFGASPLALLSSPSSRLPQTTTIDRAQLLADLRALAADDMQGREVGTPGGLKARAFVLARFRQVGLRPFAGRYEQSFAFTNNSASISGANVVGFVRGSRAGTAATNIVISAHYDHIGMHGGEVFNGADDNASGTAALFAIASYFRQHPPLHPLIFAAFDAEESGLRGSRAFVLAPPLLPGALALNLNIDMIGRDPNNTLYVVGTHLQPSLKPVIDRVAAAAPVRLLTGHDDPLGRDDDWTRDSDQYSFLQAGIPALYFGVEDYAQHHRATDDAETITVDFYERSVETLIEVIRAFDVNLEGVAAARR